MRLTTRLKNILGLGMMAAALITGRDARAEKAEAKPGDAPHPTPQSIYQIAVKPMEADTHTSATLAPYQGKVMLIVNVASKCGFTPQYEALEKIHRKYKDQGLVVLGFPANDFLNQEPGSEPEILNFCKTKYDVTFPIYGKIHVKGKEKAPLYQYLTAAAPETGEVKWNFEKFLVGKDGKVLARFRSRTKPDDKQVIEAIEKALAPQSGGASDAYRIKQ